METGGKTNKILEKILDELECLLEEFGLSGDGDLNVFKEIQHRFIFTQTLLSAEIKSVKEGEEEKRFELACMAKRLTKLEEAFDNQLTGTTNETGSFPFLVESLQEDGQEAFDDKKLSGSVSSVQEEGQDGLLKEDGDDLMAERKTNRIKRKRFRRLVSFGIVGLVAGMVSVYGYICEQMNEGTSVLTPT